MTDADLSDTVTAAVVTGVTLSGTTGGLTSADVQGMLSVTPGPVNANPGDTHNLTWTFNSNPQAFDFLAADQSLTLTYTVRAADNSSGGPLSDDQTVIITVTGTEGAPVISVVDADSAAKTLTETNAPLSTNGTLTVTDADLSDTVTAAVVTGVTLSGTTGGLTSADVQGMLSVTPGPVNANPGDTHNLTWTFNSNPQAFDFLAADQSLTLTYTVRAADNSSGGPLSDDQTVIITVTGTEDAPLISVVDTDSAAKTLTETNAPLSTNGTLTVTDADLSDTVTAAVVTGVTLSGTTGGLTSADVQGMLSVTPGPVNANPGDTHNLTWTFNSNPQAFDFLAADQSLTLTYTVRATDNSSGGPLSDDQTVIITVTGTEGAPVISVVDTDSAAKTLTETNAPLSTNGTLTVTDADLSDTVTAAVVTGVTLSGTTGGLTSADVQGMLSVTPGPVNANPGDTHNLTWTFNSNPQAFDFLAAGQSLTLTYTVRAADNSSGGPLSDDQTVIITITGTEDAPLISVVDTDSAAKTLTETNAPLSTNGTLTVTDADLSDTVTAAVVTGVTLSGTTGGLTSADVQGMLSVTPGPVNANPGDTHNLTWTFNSNPQAFDFLAADQSLTLTYTVRAADNSSGGPLSDDQTVIITVTGTEGAPVISVVDTNSAAKTLTETNAPLSTNGTLTVTDADLSDTVTAAVVTGVTLSGTTGGLTSADVQGMLSVTPGPVNANPGDTHNLTWTFNSNPQAFDFLAADQSLTLTYTVRAADNSSGGPLSDDQTVIITVTGTEDAPLISVVDTNSAAKTLTETNAPLSTNGTLTVTDADLSDTVTAAVVTGVTLSGTTGGLTSADVQGMLSVTPGPVNANPGDTHNLTWTFNSNPQAFDFLAADQSLTLTYMVRATDNSFGGPLSDDQTVIITVTGTNDKPVAVADTIAAVSEEGLPGAQPNSTGDTDTTNSASATGTISATDPENTTLHFTLGDPGSGLTSAGFLVIWQGQGTQTLTGKANGKDIVEIKINDSGQYTVTLKGPVDQADITKEDVKSFVVPVNISDGQATTPTTLTVRIEDDSPMPFPFRRALPSGKAFRSSTS